jgi:hypothetical protein
MLSSSLVCLDCFSFKSLSWNEIYEVCDSNLDSWTFKFIKKIGTNNEFFFQKFDKTKNALIYVEMVQVLQIFLFIKFCKCVYICDKTYWDFSRSILNTTFVTYVIMKTSQDELSTCCMTNICV